jgi:hypothetical protein
MSYPTVVTTPDGAKIAHDVLGSQHLGHAEPLVLVNGLGAVRGDWLKLSGVLSEIRPGMLRFV